MPRTTCKSLPLVASLTLATLPSATVTAQVPSAASIREAVRNYRTSHEVEILSELAALLAIPNVARDRENIARNAQHIVDLLEQRGASARVLAVEGSSPVVFGELRTPNARNTVVFYSHYDGQPVDTTRWETPPWSPTLRSGALESGGVELPWDTIEAGIDPEWRIYARSASDDKSPIIAMLRAIDALRENDIPLSVNLKFFFEGEEEAGSAHVGTYLRRYKEFLNGDVWIFCDGPVHQTRRPQVVFGVRGVMGMSITTYGATRVLHSGHYGNWAPNPIAMLTQLLASMRDDEGRILIENFYDDVAPPTPTERSVVASTPDVETDLKRVLSLGRTEGKGARLMERIMQPAMNLEGIRAGNVGKNARNAIPSSATANLDFRLVPSQTPEHVRELVERHITEQGFYIVHEEPDTAVRRANGKVVWLNWGTGYPAMHTSMDLPISKAVVRIVQEAADGPIVILPLLGGSLPLYEFKNVLGVPLITVPMVNHDNNQHAANENLRIRNLWEGIGRYAAIMARLGQMW
ncbi:MAG: M20/M25/M40 family metallo-hydrolase [Gemmatimonadales bacterium]